MKKIAAMLGCTGALAMASLSPAGDPVRARIIAVSAQEPATSLPASTTAAADAITTINLATALKLAGARPIDIEIAAARSQIAASQLRLANVQWLPNLYLGADYARHDGQIQDIAGKVFTTSRSSTYVGAGPVLNLAVTDAVYAPLAAKQNLRAARASERAAANDSLLAVAEAFFGVQQARGDLASAQSSVVLATELVRRMDKLAPGLAAPAEANRARAELARREQAVELARERWQSASSELARLLRLDVTALLNPAEPPELSVTLFDAERTPDELIPIALTHRPELEAEQAFVQATLTRLKQERIRPLVPSVIFRPASTSPSGYIAGGYFGGGVNSDQSNFGPRGDFDLQLVWEFRNLGFGNRAMVSQRRAENHVAELELLRTQDRIAAEVVRAAAQAKHAAVRLKLAEVGVRESLESANRSFDGLSQTRRVGEVIVLVVRPQEAVASVQSLSQANLDYYAAIADANRAQFRLYRALGEPAQCVAPVAGAPSAVKSQP